MALEAQPCESCGTKRTDDTDLYRAARPGSRAVRLHFRFERLCTRCRKPGLAVTTDGGPWEDPPPPNPGGPT